MTNSEKTKEIMTKRKEKREQKRNLPAFNKENDIKYRGPFGINHIRTAAWLCIVGGQMLVGMLLVINFFEPSEVIETRMIQSLVANLSLPLFILASFAYVLQNRKQAGRVVIFYLIVSFIIPALFALLFEHYIAGLSEKFSQVSFDISDFNMDTLAEKLFGNKIECNIFIDMLLFSSVVYFMFDVPKKFFTGRKIIAFRLFALIPIAYEITALILKYMSATGHINLSFYVRLFMPTKAPLVFIAFLMILLGEVFKEQKYLKLGGTKEGYDEFFYTKKNSLLFSKRTAQVFFFVGFSDLLLLLIFAFASNADNHSLITSASNYGIGQSIILMVLAPFVLLFSYNKVPRFKYYNLILPPISIIAIIFIYIEYAFQLIMML